MIHEVSSIEFSASLPYPAHLFNRTAFTELNRYKCDGSDVRYLLLGDNRIRGGIILGRHGRMMHSPFSAPFGGLVTKPLQRFEIIDTMWREIADYVHGEGFGLHVTVPTDIYGGDDVTKSISSLLRLGLRSVPDVSYHLAIKPGRFCDIVSRSCRKLLNQALDSGSTVGHVTASKCNIARVYRIIEENHFSKGRPVRMTLDDVMATAPVADADFFILQHDGIDVAGAMVYHVADGIVQVVYWGDRPGYGHLRPMNLLAMSVYDYYGSLGVKIVDLGPATESGEPNYGLCVFKESLGAIPRLKYTFSDH